MLPGDGEDRIQIADRPHEMGGDHGDSFWGDQRSQFGRVHLERFVHVAEYGSCADHGRRHAGGEEPDGRADDLFARTGAGGYHGTMQRGRAATDTQCIADAK